MLLLVVAAAFLGGRTAHPERAGRTPREPHAQRNRYDLAGTNDFLRRVGQEPLIVNRADNRPGPHRGDTVPLAYLA